MREYARLASWWTLRAEAIEAFRHAKTPVLDSRADYHTVADSVGERVTVFTELSAVERVGAARAVVKIGSREQPFKLFLPDAFETAEGERLLSLLTQRYVAVGGGESVERPNRSYVFVTGEVRLYPPERGTPEITVTSTEQVTDTPPV
jgi:micrococcal nuclease